MYFKTGISMRMRWAPTRRSALSSSSWSCRISAHQPWGPRRRRRRPWGKRNCSVRNFPVQYYCKIDLDPVFVWCPLCVCTCVCARVCVCEILFQSSVTYKISECVCGCDIYATPNLRAGSGVSPLDEFVLASFRRCDCVLLHMTGKGRSKIGWSGTWAARC